MATIKAFADKWKALNLQKEAMFVVAETSDEITDLNKEQLLSGEDKESKRIRPKYKSPSYARKKNEMNSLPGLGLSLIHI